MTCSFSTTLYDLKCPLTRMKHSNSPNDNKDRNEAQNVDVINSVDLKPELNNWREQLALLMWDEWRSGV